MQYPTCILQRVYIYRKIIKYKISCYQTVVCPLMGLSQGASMYFSSFSIVLIAVDRFMFICKPHWKPISTQMVRKLQFCNTI